MRYAIIKNGKVNNIAKATPEFAAEQGWVEAQNANIGYLYENGVFTAPPPDVEFATADIELAAADVRAKRNQLLLSSDWTQVLDSPVDKAVWATYRQALRNIPSQQGFPWDVQWPTQPE